MTSKISELLILSDFSYYLWKFHDSNRLNIPLAYKRSYLLDIDNERDNKRKLLYKLCEKIIITDYHDYNQLQINIQQLIDLLNTIVNYTPEDYRELLSFDWTTVVYSHKDNLKAQTHLRGCAGLYIEWFNNGFYAN